MTIMTSLMHPIGDVKVREKMSGRRRGELKREDSREITTNRSGDQLTHDAGTLDQITPIERPHRGLTTISSRRQPVL